MIVNKDYVIGRTDKRIFGSFLEHVGRAVYGGIYEPEHPLADEHGFRRDVADAIRELEVPIIRYPGGNFVSGYRWEDGVGPRELRPRVLERAWSSVETNQVGTDEFCRYCRRIGTDPLLAVNLGTRGAGAAANLVEYCNCKTGTKYADMRAANGSPEPYGVKTWCLGNEMDGEWQIGHKTAAEYGRLAKETAALMKMTDPTIELVLCGSSGSGMQTFPAWDAGVLFEAYNNIEYISLHSYYENNDGDSASFLASNADMDRYIKKVSSVCDYVKTAKRSSKTIMLSYDEWNVWYHFSRPKPFEAWTVAPPLFEDVYGIEDAVALGGMLISLLRNSDRVKIACLAQLVNVIAPITTEPGGRLWKQTTYYPFLHASLYGRGRVLNTVSSGDMYECKKYGTVPYVDSVCVLSDGGELTVFACNRHLTNSALFEIELQNLSGYVIAEHIVLCGGKDDVNTADNPDKVLPRVINDTDIADNTCKISLPAISWNVIRLFKAEKDK